MPYIGVLSSLRWSPMGGCLARVPYIFLITSVCDNNPNTWWGSSQDCTVVELPFLDGITTVNTLAIDWHLGNHRAYRFEVEAYSAGTWKNVFKGDSSGTTESTEVYFFNPVAPDRLRIIGRGFGNDFAAGPWTSVAEVHVYQSNP
jgi:hypothetical protein